MSFRSVHSWMQVFTAASHMLTSRVSSSHCCVTLEEGEIFKNGTRLEATRRDASRLRAAWSVFRRDGESSWACCVMTAEGTECIVVSRSSGELSLAPDKQKWVSVSRPRWTWRQFALVRILKVFLKPGRTLIQRKEKYERLWKKTVNMERQKQVSAFICM